MTAPVLTRPAHYLGPFATELADRLGVETQDVATALVDLVLAGLVELSVVDGAIVLRANPPEEVPSASTTNRRLPPQAG